MNTGPNLPRAQAEPKTFPALSGRGRRISLSEFSPTPVYVFGKIVLCVCVREGHSFCPSKCNKTHGALSSLLSQLFTQFPPSLYNHFIDDAHYLSWCCQPQASTSNSFVKCPLIFVLLTFLQNQQPAGQLTVGVRQAPPVRVREPQAGTDHGADAAFKKDQEGKFSRPI